MLCYVVVKYLLISLYVLIKHHEISVRYFVMSLLVKFSMQTAPARMSAVLFSVCFINWYMVLYWGGYGGGGGVTPKYESSRLEGQVSNKIK